MPSNKYLLNVFLDVCILISAGAKGYSIYSIIMGKTEFAYLLVYAMLVGYVVLFFRLEIIRNELKKMFSKGQPIHYYPLAFILAIVGCPLITTTAVLFVIYDLGRQIYQVVSKK